MKYVETIILGLWILLSSCHSDSEVREQGNQGTSDLDLEKVEIVDIETGIKAYIQEKVEQGEGYFHLKEKEHDLQLKLVRVHTEYLSNLGPNRHFACVDLADVSGDVYDVDFFLEGSPGNMEVNETTLHKLNGKPFYSWKQRKDKTWYRVPIEEASTELLGIIEDKDEFEFRYHVELPEITDKADIWIPIAQSDSFQIVELITLKAPGKQKMLVDNEYGNSILHLELGPENSEQDVEIIYNVQRMEKGPNDAKESEVFKYLESDRLVPVNDRFRNIAREAIKEKYKDGKLVQARALYDYIIDNMRYMKFGNYGRGDAIYACDSKTGNCTEFHSFFISLARSAGIPARFSIGASIPSDRNEGGIDGYHCWAEFYAEGKWWPVDISEANKYTALATYYFGRHPANRIELSRGRDLEVDSGPQSGPINFLAYPILEIGGKLTTAHTTFSFTRKSI